MFRMNFSGDVGHATNAYDCMLFSSRVGVRIRFSVWLVTGNADVFIQLSVVVVVTVPTAVRVATIATRRKTCVLREPHRRATDPNFYQFFFAPGIISQRVKLILTIDPAISACACAVESASPSPPRKSFFMTLLAFRTQQRQCRGRERVGRGVAHEA